MGDTPPDAAAAALEATRLPPSARAAWASAPPEPVPGQVWRTRWDRTAILVLLLDVGRTEILVCPVTADPELSNESALVVPSDRSSLATPLVAWVALRRQLPVRVLDRCIGEIQPAVVKAVVDDRYDDWLIRGRLAVFDSDPSLQERARLEDRLDVLESATWAPAGGGGLKELFDAVGLDLAQIRDLPGVPSGGALSVRRGERPLGAAQIEALATRTGIAAQRWWDANPQLPAALVDALDQPWARTKVVALGSAEARSEIETWREVAYDVFALAARQTGEADQPDWTGRIGQYFAGRGLR